MRLRVLSFLSIIHLISSTSWADTSFEENLKFLDQYEKQFQKYGNQELNNEIADLDVQIKDLSDHIGSVKKSEKLLVEAVAQKNEELKVRLQSLMGTQKLKENALKAVQIKNLSEKEMKIRDARSGILGAKEPQLEAYHAAYIAVEKQDLENSALKVRLKDHVEVSLLKLEAQVYQWIQLNLQEFPKEKLIYTQCYWQDKGEDRKTNLTLVPKHLMKCASKLKVKKARKSFLSFVEPKIKEWKLQFEKLKDQVKQSQNTLSKGIEKRDEVRTLVMKNRMLFDQRQHEIEDEFMLLVSQNENAREKVLEQIEGERQKLLKQFEQEEAFYEKQLEEKQSILLNLEQEKSELVIAGEELTLTQKRQKEERLNQLEQDRKNLIFLSLTEGLDEAKAAGSPESMKMLSVLNSYKNKKESVNFLVNLTVKQPSFILAIFHKGVKQNIIIPFEGISSALFGTAPESIQMRKKGDKKWVTFDSLQDDYFSYQLTFKKDSLVTVRKLVKESKKVVLHLKSLKRDSKPLEVVFSDGSGPLEVTSKKQFNLCLGFLKSLDEMKTVEGVSELISSQLNAQLFDLNDVAEKFSTWQEHRKDYGQLLSTYAL